MDPVEPVVESSFRKKMDDIKNNPRKMWIAIISLFIIFLALTYIAVFNKQISIISFSDGCNETYINGRLNGSECTIERQMLEEQRGFNLPEANLNFTLK
jgi:hypothetical protein